MIKGLTEYEKFKVIRPIIGDCNYDMIEGMTGTFLNFRYTDTFYKKSSYEQLSLEGISKVFTIKEVA